MLTESVVLFITFTVILLAGLALLDYRRRREMAPLRRKVDRLAQEVETLRTEHETAARSDPDRYSSIEDNRRPAYRRNPKNPHDWN